MKAQELYQLIEDEYRSDMVPSIRQDGRAYYWQAKRTNPESTRIVRISANKAGDIFELKLAVNENKGVGPAFLALPASQDDIISAVRSQVELFRRGAHTTT
ncbi:MAG: hypothetical protein ACRYF7_07910 [Janthinobacterium lividum]